MVKVSILEVELLLFLLVCLSVGSFVLFYVFQVSCIHITSVILKFFNSEN